MKWPRRSALLGLLTGLVVLLDQCTKLWVHSNFRLGEQRTVIPGFLDLHYIRNTGAAFGFLSGTHASFRIPFFVLVSVAAIGIILYLAKKMEDTGGMSSLSLSLVLGGAIGNLVDRIRLGEVIDFVSVHYRWFRWPAFNVADSAITVGVILLVYRIVFPRRSLESRQ